MADLTAPSSGPRPAAGDPQFLQGTVLAWNAIAGTNVVRVRGRECANLPSLVGSETGLMRVGDAVILIKLHNSYAVLGRIETSGVEPRALGVVSARAGGTVSTASSTFVDLSGGPSVAAYIGSSRRCRVDISAYVSGVFGLASVGFKVMGPSGALSIPADYQKTLSAGASSPTATIGVQLSGTRTVNLSATDGLTEGLNTFVMQYQFLSDGAGSGSEFADREIAVQPF